MTDRRVRAGESIVLRARFLDDLGEVAQASGVQLFIFDPDADADDNSSALIQGALPSYFDEGIFEYTFPVPHVGPDGVWTDKWLGSLTSQNLEARFQFEVSQSGVIEQFSNQLYVNNYVEVVLHTGIRALDGASLKEEYSFTFLTEISPAYTSVRKVRLDYGGYLANLEDDTLQLAILESSLEADELTFATVQNTKVFQHARREWSTCRTGLTLLSNLGSTSIKFKQLGDLSVSYDTNNVRDAMEKALACLQKWEPQLIAGGYARASVNPQMVIKGELDPDRPAIGRLWRDPSTEPSTLDSRLPAANTRDRIINQRRYRSIFSSVRKKFW